MNAFTRYARSPLNGVLTLALLLFVVSLTPGCAKIQPGNDVVVVRAEQLATFATEATDVYVSFEYRNRDALWAIDHGFKAAGDEIRTNGAKSLTALRDATKAYKANRTPENKASLYTWVAVVEKLIQDVNLWTSKAPTAIRAP